MSDNDTESQKLIFTGTLLFLSLSFGLFNISLSLGVGSISKVTLFISLILIALISGGLALVSSYWAIRIKYTGDTFGKFLQLVSFITFFIMFIALVILHITMYADKLAQLTNIKPPIV